MKYIKVIFISLAVLKLAACNEEEKLPEQEESVLFNLSSNDLAENGRTTEINKARAIVISVEDPAGHKVLDAEKIPLYNFNGSYTSEPVSLKPGQYLITDFMVVDEKDSVLFISPKEESERAHLVNDPLPLPFQVKARQTNEITVTVLRAEGSPQAYGYVSFSYHNANTLKFRVQSFAIDEGQPAEYAEPEFIMVDSRVQIFMETENETNKIYDDTVTAANNLVELGGNFSSISLLVKVSNINYKTYRKTFTRTELEEFLSDPLKITLQRHEFKQILVIEDRFNTVYTPTADPDILFYVTSDGESYKMDVSDLDNPGKPVYMGNYGYTFGEDPYGKLYLGNYYSTDLGNTWQAVTGERPLHSFVEFKGDNYGLSGNNLYRETGRDQWELVEVLPFYSGPATTDKRLIVYDDKLFAVKGLLVSEDGETFSETIDTDPYLENYVEPAGMFTALGNLYMKTEIHSVQGDIYRWADGSWESVYQYDAELGSPLFTDAYNNHMVLVEFNKLNIFNFCSPANCEPVYSNFFNWVPDQMPPATIRGRHIGGDRIYIQDRVTNDHGEYLFALDLSEIEFE